METNYQKFLAGEYCNHLDQEVLQMIVQTKNLLAERNQYNRQRYKRCPLTPNARKHWQVFQH